MTTQSVNQLHYLPSVPYRSLGAAAILVNENENWPQRIIDEFANDGDKINVNSGKSYLPQRCFYKRLVGPEMLYNPESKS